MPIIEELGVYLPDHLLDVYLDRGAAVAGEGVAEKKARLAQERLRKAYEYSEASTVSRCPLRDADLHVNVDNYETFTDDEWDRFFQSASVEAHGGRCHHCSTAGNPVTHAIARTEMAQTSAKALLARISGEGDTLSAQRNSLHGEGKGKMVGVLLCVDATGQLCTVKAYSGPQIAGTEAEYAPGLTRSADSEQNLTQKEAAVDTAKDALKNQAEADWMHQNDVNTFAPAEDDESLGINSGITKLRESLAAEREKDPQNAEKIAGMETTLDRLIGRRTGLIATKARENMERAKAAGGRALRDAAEEGDPDADPYSDLREAVSDAEKEYEQARAAYDVRSFCDNHGKITDLATGPDGERERVSGNAGICAAPKLLSYAAANNLVPVSIAEFWIGAGDKWKEGQFIDSCEQCVRFVGSMMCGLKDRQQGQRA